MWRLVVCLLAGCFVSSPVVRFGGGKSAHEAQHDMLTDLLPAPLSMEKLWSGPVATATIRVYADDQYRAQNIGWQKTFDGILEYANAVLEPTLGVKLVAEYHEWKHHAPSATLEQHMTELAALDDGAGVLSVVGLTSSLGLVSATFDQLGIAQVGGRHMMLRGYSDGEERRAFVGAFPSLSADERNNALAARRIHKTTTVFLHELAHNLGAQHDRTDDTIMTPQYSHHAAAFTADTHSTIQATLNWRLGIADKSVPAPTMASAPASGTHGTLAVRVLKDGYQVDGRLYDESELGIVFSTQAALDAQIEVVIDKDPDAPREALAATAERAKSMGLSRITFK